MSDTTIMILIGLKASRRYKEKFIVPIYLTQEGLAQRIGVDRGNISRTLRQLMTSGFVKAEMKHIINKKRRCNPSLAVYNLLNLPHPVRDI